MMQRFIRLASPAVDPVRDQPGPCLGRGQIMPRAKARSRGTDLSFYYTLTGEDNWPYAQSAGTITRAQGQCPPSIEDTPEDM